MINKEDHPFYKDFKRVQDKHKDTKLTETILKVLTSPLVLITLVVASAYMGVNKRALKPIELFIILVTARFWIRYIQQKTYTEECIEEFKGIAHRKERLMLALATFGTVSLIGLGGLILSLADP